MIRLLRAALSAVAVSVLLTACGGGRESSEIVVTTNILGDVVRAIVGDAAPVRVLMKPNADPHSFGISAQEAVAVSSAAVLVHNGLGLEEGLGRNEQSAAESGVPTLAVGDHVDPIDYRTGDAAGNPDPHFWMDPERMRKAVDVISSAVTANVAGIDTDRVTTRAEAYRRQLDMLAATMADRFGSVPPARRQLVTNHHVLGYLAQRYGYRVVGAVVPSGTTLAAPSSSDVKSLADAIRTARVPAIFADSSQPERLARVLAEQAGIDVRVVALYTESLGPEGTSGATYLDMMRANTDSIVTALR